MTIVIAIIVRPGDYKRGKQMHHVSTFNLSSLVARDTQRLRARKVIKTSRRNEEKSLRDSMEIVGQAKLPLTLQHYGITHNLVFDVSSTVCLTVFCPHRNT